MSNPIERRRSQRVFLKVPVRVYGTYADGSRFYEEGLTIMVSVHGALLEVEVRAEVGLAMILTNMASGEDMPCRVIYLEKEKTKKPQFAVEFHQEAPNFWPVAFPSPEKTRKVGSVEKPVS